MILLLLGTFLISSTFSAYAVSELNINNTQRSFSTSQYNVIVLQEENLYEKLELTDILTGEIQIVETFLGQNPRVVISNKDKKELLVVESDENQVKVFENNQLVYIEQIDRSENSTQGWTDWTGWSYWNTSKKTYWGTALGYASLMAGILNAPVGILLGICDIAYTNLVTEVWWVKGLRQRYDFSQSLAENHETINAYSQSVRTEEYLINKDGPVNYYYFTSID